MDHDAFDRLTRLLGMAGSRRAALAALLGGGALGAAESVLGKGRGKKKDTNKHKKRKEPAKKRGKPRRANQAQPTPPDPPETDEIAAEATCSSPGPSSNLNNCNFTGQDLDLVDLSSSSMKSTRFNNASLCGADLSSSTLTNAEFNGANLTKADLGSSSCRGLKTNAATRFCRTRLCSGAIDNSDCPVGVEPCCQERDCRRGRASL